MSNEKTEKTEKNRSDWPSSEFRFFVYDPQGDGMSFFKTAELRDAAAKDAIKFYINDDGWDKEVESVFAGNVAAVATKTNIIERPPADQINDDGMDEDGRYWGEEHDFCCDYELLPIQAAEQVAPVAEEIENALGYSRNFATAKPNIGRTEKEHILDLCNLLEQVAKQAAPAAVQDELRKRCKEILEWKKSGVLSGNALREYANAQWYADEVNSLQMAETDTVNQAFTLLSAAPTPQAQQSQWVPDEVREAIEAAFEDRPGWRLKIARAVRVIGDAVAPEQPDVVTVPRELLEWIDTAELREDWPVLRELVDELRELLGDDV